MKESPYSRSTPTRRTPALPRGLVLAFLSAALAAFAQEQTPGRGLAGRFQQLDRNGDGRLSREEVDAWPGLKAGFDTIDANHDGGISLDEMKTATARWQQRRPEPEGPPATNAPPKRAAVSVAKQPAPRRPATADANSPQFRGPRGDGVAYGANLPDTWNTTTNVVWTCAIPGKGWSSPVVWGDRVFVTSAVGPGSVEAPPQLHSLAEHVNGVTTTAEHQYMLHCVDWGTGKLLWSRCAHNGVPPGLIHPKNSYASETPVTDAERVYAYFGGIGLFCYDLDGRELWSRLWGSFKMGWNWGTSASPVLHGDQLFVLNDNQERSFLVALDTRTGKDVWRVDRDEKSNWSTPFVWQHELRTEIVTAGSGKVRSYDLNGKLLWELRGMSNVTVPTPFAAEGLLYVASGCNNSALRPVYAIHPGAAGDISLPGDATANAQVAWSQRRAAPYVTSPARRRGLPVSRPTGSLISTLRRAESAPWRRRSDGRPNMNSPAMRIATLLRERGAAAAALPALAILLALPSAAADPAPRIVKQDTVLAEDAVGPSWIAWKCAVLPVADLVYANHKDWNLWTMDEHGGNKRCLTGFGDNALGTNFPLDADGAGPAIHWKGAPMAHPTLPVIIFKAENDHSAHKPWRNGPSIGWDNDLWALDLREKRYDRLTSLPAGQGLQCAAISDDGTWFVYPLRYDNGNPRKDYGLARMVFCELALDAKGRLQLLERFSLEPNGPMYYEPNDVRRNTSGSYSLLYAAGPGKCSDPYLYEWTWDGQKPSGTNKALQTTPDVHEEFFTFSPSGRTIAWMKGALSRGAYFADLYFSNPDFTEPRRVTWYNDRQAWPDRCKPDGAQLARLVWKKDGTAIFFGLWVHGGTFRPYVKAELHRIDIVGE